MEVYSSPDFEKKIQVISSDRPRILIWKHHSSVSQDPKADGSPLTVADLEANKIICDGLRKLFPAIPIISEESKNADYEERKDWEYFWCDALPTQCLIRSEELIQFIFFSKLENLQVR
jgi:3'-phosphoadenosine 5'-phosphosulfate (PAPS) 3'-phosphatase